MTDKICPLLDFISTNIPNHYLCYANGRLLGLYWMADYCRKGSNLGHEACPILTAGDNAAYTAWEHYNRLSKR